VLNGLRENPNKGFECQSKRKMLMSETKIKMEQQVKNDIRQKEGRTLQETEENDL
jgi:hypothetical protein